MRGWTIVCLGLVAACGGAMRQQEIAFPEFHAKLSNGMSVVVLPDPTTSLVEVDVRYAVGSREDPAGKAGLAHLVEHLMFQQRPGGVPIIAVLRELSVYFNAQTDFDSTHYQTLAKAELAEKLVALEVARLEAGCQTIDEETFAREREVVRNEIRTRLGTPESQVDYLLLEAIYPPGHPYRRHIGGDDQQLASITIDDVCKFMHDYYVPERASFIIAGGVDENRGKQLIGRILGPVPPRAGAVRVPVPPVKLDTATVNHEMEVEEASVFAAWALPPSYSDEYRAALDFVGQLAGRAAWLGDTYEFASHLSVQVVGGAEAPALILQISVADPAQIEEAKSTLRRAAGGLRRYLGDSQEIADARARISGEAVFRLDSLPERAMVFADYAQFHGHRYSLSDEVARAQKWDPGRVSTVGREVLDVDKARLIVVRPKKGAPPRLRRAALAYAAKGNQPDELPVDRAEAARSIVAPAQAVPVGRSRTLTLENGMRVVLVPLRGRVPVVTAALSFRIGFGVEPPERAGIAEVAARTMYGSEGLQRLAHIGAGGAVLVGTDSSTFYARGMANHVEALLIGLQRWVEVGRYEQERIEAWTRRARIGIHRPSQRAERAFATIWRSAVFGPNHPYARDGEPTDVSLGEIGHDSVETFKSRYYVARNATLVLVGDFDSAQVESVVRSRFGSWTQGEVAAPMPPVEQQRGGSRFVGVIGQHLEMVPLAIAYRVDRAIDENYAERLVLAEMLSNRVRVIREKLGASYGVYASLVSYEQGGAYVIRGSVDPLRAGESLRVLRDAVASLRRGEGFVEDFVRARRRVLEQRLAAASSTFDLARQLAWTDRYGLPPSFENDLAQAVAALTPNAVLKRMTAELGADHEVVVLLGKQPVLGKAFAEAGVDSAQIMKEP